MKKLLVVLSILGVYSAANAQQLPDPHFESWGGKFNGDVQLTEWHGSNVNQAGLKFTFIYQKPGRTGHCAYMTDRAVGIPKLGIGATGPGYLSLGVPWNGRRYRLETPSGHDERLDQARGTQDE